jgi:hypothetical protein
MAGRFYLQQKLPPPENGVNTPTVTLATKSFLYVAFKLKTSYKFLGYNSA